MLGRAFAALLAAAVAAPGALGKDTCSFKSTAGVQFDLSDLASREGKSDGCFYLRDGDVPCTPTLEPSFDYLVSVCGELTSSCVNEYSDVCSAGTGHQVVQWLDSDCHVVGRYDPTFALLSNDDPAAGVSITFGHGDKCEDGTVRSMTVNMECSGVQELVHAEEPTHCAYSLYMKSPYGCPSSCVHNGKMCNDHGLCRYDASAGEAYCHCNQGYSGSSCTKSGGGSSDDDGYDGFSVQLALTIVMLVVTLALVGTVGFMVWKIRQYRLDGAGAGYMGLPAESELAAQSLNPA